MIAPRLSPPGQPPSFRTRRACLSRFACLARIARAAAGAGVAGAVAMGCGSSFPPPPLVPQTDDAFTEVPYPPPPAQVEFVPDVPAGNVAWVDGAWTWEGTQWRWTRGGWFNVPAGTAYAPWQTKRAPDGRLLFAPAVWRGANGAPLEPPEPVAPALSGKALQRKKDAPQKGAPSQKGGPAQNEATPAQPQTQTQPEPAPSPAEPPRTPAEPAQAPVEPAPKAAP